ncbi:hypothetical protein [Pontiella sp.]|uniref:hypothetical protein n=1 Tax=Pontiella sp. TaxID=2837462 RepID=UPI0035656F30
MECVLTTQFSCCGLDEEISGLSSLEYLVKLPGYRNSVGILSKRSFRQLTEERKQQIRKCKLLDIDLTTKTRLFKSTEEHLVYSIKSIDPVFHEVQGFNSIVSFKSDAYEQISLLESFLTRDYGFSDQDFANLDLVANYVVSSYYEDDAFHFYSNECMSEVAVSIFNDLCKSRCGSDLTIEELN